MKNLLIIGGGPAGVSAALYAVRGGVSVTLLHNNGGALVSAEKIANFYGQSAPKSGRELYENGLTQAKNLGVYVTECEVTGLQYDGAFKAASTDGDFSADAVILCAGAKRITPKLARLADFEGKGVSYCAVCDGFFHRKKEVAVLGSDSYAAAEAAELAHIASKVTVLTDEKEATADFGSCEIIKKKVAALDGGDKLDSIVFEDGQRLAVSGLFIALGTAGAVDLARKLGVVVSGGYIPVDDKMRTNIPGLFAAGDCTGGLLQVTKAAADGAKAGLAALEYLRGKA